MKYQLACTWPRGNPDDLVILFGDMWSWPMQAEPQNYPAHLRLNLATTSPDPKDFDCARPGHSFVNKESRADLELEIYFIYQAINTMKILLLKSFILLIADMCQTVSLIMHY